MSTLWIVTSTYWKNPAWPAMQFPSHEEAVEGAVGRVNAILKDSGWQQTATADSWQDILGTLKEYYEGAPCAVDVTEHPVN